MEYQQFISTVSKHQTDRIKAVNIPESSSPYLIPESFKALLLDVIDILQLT